MKKPDFVFLCQRETEILPDLKPFCHGVLGLGISVRVWRGCLLSACVWSPCYLPAFQNYITKPISLELTSFLFRCLFFALILSPVDPAAQHQGPPQLFTASALFLCIFHPLCCFHGSSAHSKGPVKNSCCVQHFWLLLDSVFWGVDMSSGVHWWTDLRLCLDIVLNCTVQLWKNSKRKFANNAKLVGLSRQ